MDTLYSQAMTEPNRTPERWKRRIGAYGGAQPGPVVIAVCGIHGNEPAGARAAAAVLEDLERRRPPFRGEFVALSGNLEALARGRRFIDTDLNRMWTASRIAALEAGQSSSEESSSAAWGPIHPRGADSLNENGQGPPPSAGRGTCIEDLEQLDIWRSLRVCLDRSHGPAVLLDLHTSSADGPPFATMGDTLRNRAFVMQLPVPVILGLEEQIDGALLEYVNNLGHVTAGFEAGRHDLESSLDRHVALLWLSLVAAGNVREEDVPEVDRYRDLLERATDGIPRIVEMRHRHAIRGGDDFTMRPGFRNFAPVRSGDVLATDRQGPIRARESGVVLLPLYQGQGDDGFFLGREVRPFWLKLSALLRRLGVPSLPRLLPGVRRHPVDAGTLIVDTWVARLFPLEVFHLLGYRKRRWRGRCLIITRRRENAGA